MVRRLLARTGTEGAQRAGRQKRASEARSAAPRPGSARHASHMPTFRERGLLVVATPARALGVRSTACARAERRLRGALVVARGELVDPL
jgi:hypothetical protein